MLQWSVLELSAVCLGKVKKFAHYFFSWNNYFLDLKTLVCMAYISLCPMLF